MEDEETADEMFEKLGDEKTFTEVDKESNIFEELKKKIREAKTEEKMSEALKETIELTIKTVDRMTEHIAKQRIRIKELEEYIVIAPNLDEMTAIKYLSIQRYGYIKGKVEEQQKAVEIINKNYIPKQKVKDKIEENNKIMIDTQNKYPGTYAMLDEWRNAKAQNDILEELLEDK